MSCRGGFRETSSQCCNTMTAVPVALWACYYYCVMFWKMARETEWLWAFWPVLLEGIGFDFCNVVFSQAILWKIVPWRKCWHYPRENELTKLQTASLECYFWQTMFFPWIALILLEDPAGIEVLRHIMFSGTCEDKLVVNFVFWGKCPQVRRWKIIPLVC